MNDKLIEGIKRYGHRYIFVDVAGDRVGRRDYGFKRSIRGLTKDMLQRVFESIRTQSPLPDSQLMEWADHISDAVLQEQEVHVHVGDLELDKEEELISHSVNVTFLSLLTARKLGYKHSALREVAIGSLLHDIGLVRPMDTAVVIRHPVIGLEMARRIKGIPEASLRMIAQHHEQVDGRGFPHGLDGGRIDEASQIVGLSSEFDLFLRDGARKRLPCEGVDFIMSKIDTSFSYGVVSAFVKSYQPYPTGTQVRLTGGLLATVCEQNKGHSCRPVVKLAQFGTRFDLLSHTTFRIEEVLAEPAFSLGGTIA
ncbi:HD-GYP domain-containing protein [Cohnella thailandensis]|uniref:HDIG domain-containing protein n=1 Tax=Cohnella thailandensis TaxID=557557 RepID=A0A841T2T9_9BACL|nr:HD domain-containing phosphohydrolase [Cohnella thailandensis]MBB6636197.1 HDIG domain-containing protein [Cohnella thailandensis]MBP1973834.1 putative nucleotidyltransferase with HDIG domain [Cohnella thailandensis]